MKILKAYRNEEDKNNFKAYGSPSPVIKEIRKRYGLDEIIVDPDSDPAEYAKILRNYDVLITSWSSPRVPDELADNPGNLRYICNITGSVGGWIGEPIIASPYIQVTNWGDAVGYGMAEGAVALLMTMLKDIPNFIAHARNDLDRPDRDERRVGTLFNTKLGIYGMGYIARKFVEYLRPFSPDFYAFDPYVDDMPEGVKKVDTLDELFQISQIVAVHAGLTPETTGSVTKEHLAMLPDGAIIINTARGPIIDEPALIAEIMSGRIRAGLDVMDQRLNPENGDMPAIDDPVRQVSNAVFTGHHIGGNEWGRDPEDLGHAELNALANLERFKNGEPLKFVIDVDRYRKMT